jgi:prepilin-type N-terminal cleavage/methylation domain-containing protein
MFQRQSPSLSQRSQSGFSLLELMASVVIIGIVMGGVFTFLYQSQRRFQGNTVITQSNQAARAGLEVMTQEIGEAGFNPQYTSSITSSVSLTAAVGAQCITLSDASAINPGDWVSVDSGTAYEQVPVLATSTAALSGQTACGGANQIKAVFKQCHNQNLAPCPAGGSTGAFLIGSYKFPYPSGILQGQTVSYGGSNKTISNDHILAMFYGDTNNSGNLWYVVYSLYNPSSSTPTSVTIGGQTFYLYTLYRSVTQVTFATGATVTHAYPLVQNVLYQDINGTNPVGPSAVPGGTGQPIFTYRFTAPVTMVPSTVSVVGTIVVNLCVAVNPQALETGKAVQWYTLATQVRPVNLWSAVTVNRTGGGRYLPPTPVGLPMLFPTLSSYYF